MPPARRFVFAADGSPTSAITVAAPRVDAPFRLSATAGKYDVIIHAAGAAQRLPGVT